MQRFANPTKFMRFSGRALPWITVLAGMLLAAGLYLALLVSPPDYQQGETVRIMYIHVPAAWIALGAYALMGLASGVYLIWKHPLADVAARECAPLGAGFTLLCMITGSLWGKPMWGAWWVWDARLTSVLVLFFLYIGYIALDSAVEQGERGRKLCAILALVGLANLPVIRFSVEWWNTLHQPASVMRMAGPAIHPDMLLPLMVMGTAFSLLFAVLWLVRIRAALLMQKLRRIQLRG